MVPTEDLILSCDAMDSAPSCLLDVSGSREGVVYQWLVAPAPFSLRCDFASANAGTDGESCHYARLSSIDVRELKSFKEEFCVRCHERGNMCGHGAPRARPSNTQLALIFRTRNMWARDSPRVIHIRYSKGTVHQMKWVTGELGGRLRRERGR